jgi:hypothetical protein
MEKEFVPYEQALALKELGFDKPCFAYYDKHMTGVLYGNLWNGNPIEMGLPDNSVHVECTAPTFSQAFRWFREKYDLHYKIEPTIKNKYTSYISQLGWDYIDVYKTYEEAELACLIKLIEIIKNNNGK